MSTPPVNYGVPLPPMNVPPAVLPDSLSHPGLRPVQSFAYPSQYDAHTIPVNHSSSPLPLPPFNIPPPNISGHPHPAMNLNVPFFVPSRMPYSISDQNPYYVKDNQYTTNPWEPTSSSSNTCKIDYTTPINIRDRRSLERPIFSKEKADKYYPEVKSNSSSSAPKYTRNRSNDRESGRSFDQENKMNYDRDRRGRQRGYRYSRSRSRSPRSYHSRSPSRYRSRESCREKYRDKYDARHSYERRDVRESKRYDHDRHYSPARHYDHLRYSRSHSHHRSSQRKSPPRHHHRSPSHKRSLESVARSRHESESSRKSLTDREKILEEYRKNYCKTSEDFIEKIKQWSKEHNTDEDESQRMWFRSSPAELYYKTIEGSVGVEQTSKLQKLCDTFYKKLIERGRSARPEVDELPPLKTVKQKMCKHKLEEGSSSSSESDECLDEDGLQGYTDRIMLELQRKQSHPRRLHPEMWYNNVGEINGGPLCRCSARARRHGMRHGVYAGEQSFPKCVLTQNNIDRLYHYRITVSPPTNFLIKAPTIIAHDEHEFLFSGFSMFSHYKLAKLPTCKVIRFNIEYTILYVEEPPPQNFTIRELDLFEDYLFTELLELVDLDLGKATENSCSQFHFMPQFVRHLSEGGCEVLSMCEVLKYLIEESGLLIPPNLLHEVHNMDHYTWQKFVDKIKGMIVTYPGKKPCSVRVDQLDRSPPNVKDTKESKELKSFYPEIVHFGIRPPQLSYAGNPEYQKVWRYYVKYRHLVANMAKPTMKERQKLAAKEANLQEMRTQSKMKRDVIVAVSSEGFHTTGLMCDVVQHAMLIPVLVRHLRFHKSLDMLEQRIGHVFERRALLQTALTHPSYRENFGTNPDHARNTLANCGVRQLHYGDRRIHYTRKKGIVTLINIMSRFEKRSETESEIKHNERLEFLGDAVVEFLSSIHLFRMFPGLAEGGLATYRASIVQNQHLALLAKNIGLEQFMLYAHGSDLCSDVVMRHAMANCFEALMGALFLDGGLEVADRVFSLALWYNEPDLLEVWTKERGHPLQEQEPLGDRKYIKDFEFLQKLTAFEDSIGVQFKHIRLLARAFTDRSVGFTHLTLGSNQRLEFLGDTVLQLVVSDRLYRHFPEHHEGHLSLLRSSLVNNRTQAMVCDDLDMSAYAVYNNPKAKPTTKKHKADLLEAFMGALYIDKNLEYCQAFCSACLFPRLQEFIMNQDWNDPKSKLQQCCLTLRSMEGGEPDIPLYKVIECLGPTNTRVYTVGVYFRGTRLAAARGHSIQEAEMNAAAQALSCAHELFPQLDHQKRIISKIIREKKKNKGRSGDVPNYKNALALKRKGFQGEVPKAYRLDQPAEKSDSSDREMSAEEVQSEQENKSDEDSGLDSDTESVGTDATLANVQVSSLVSDMEKIKEDLIRRNEYDKLKEKCKRSDSDDD